LKTEQYYSDGLRAFVLLVARDILTIFNILYCYHVIKY